MYTPQGRGGRSCSARCRAGSDGAGHALVADDDQVRPDLLGNVEDRVGRVALARVGLASTPASRASGRRLEERVHVLARTDSVRDVAGNLLSLVLSRSCGTASNALTTSSAAPVRLASWVACQPRRTRFRTRRCQQRCA